MGPIERSNFHILDGSINLSAAVVRSGANSVHFVRRSMKTNKVEFTALVLYNGPCKFLQLVPIGLFYTASRKYNF